MKAIFSRKAIITIFVLVVVAIGLFIFWSLTRTTVPVSIVPPVEDMSKPRYKVIGQSVEGRKIEAFTFGRGEKKLLFIGGIHGGYEWNSVLLAYKILDYISANPQELPKEITLTIIPSLNPDGVYKVVGKEGRFLASDISSKADASPGRFNANKVDLNRNFACKWQAESMWRGSKVSAGTQAFSEPEAKALRDFVFEIKPAAVVFWHSQANAVYASSCESGILPETKNILETYSTASGYPAKTSFDSYAITGAAEDWLASIGVPTITIELKNHEDIEWEKNLLGIKSLFKYYSGTNII